MEIILQRIADRPLAGALRQFRQRQATGNRRDHVFGRNVIENLCGLDVDLLIQRGCRVRTGENPRRRRIDAACKGRRAWGRCSGALGRRARRSDRTASLDASRQIEAMDLADHGITADAAELRCNLAGAKALGP
ncbi:hypothetical protein D3C80_224220 [compost metagenome]